MIGERADNHVNIRRPPANFGPFGLGHTTGGNNGGAAAIRAGLAQATDIGIELFGGAFADVAGVEQHHVGCFRRVDGGQPVSAEQIAHPLTVIDVHLAAEGLDVVGLGAGW